MICDSGHIILVPTPRRWRILASSTSTRGDEARALVYPTYRPFFANIMPNLGRAPRPRPLFGWRHAAAGAMRSGSAESQTSKNWAFPALLRALPHRAPRGSRKCPDRPTYSRGWRIPRPHLSVEPTEGVVRVGQPLLGAPAEGEVARRAQGGGAPRCI